jgi:hypothetical protein
MSEVHRPSSQAIRNFRAEAATNAAAVRKQREYHQGLQKSLKLVADTPGPKTMDAVQR